MKEDNFPTLYQYEACPFCWKVRALMGYRGIPYSTIEVHPINKKELSFSKDYRKVPVLIDREGKRVTESTHIMKHLDGQYPGSHVFSGTPEETRWLEWSDSTLVRALPPLIYGSLRQSLRSFDYITRVSKFTWMQQRVIKWMGAIVMRIVARKSAKQQDISNPAAHLDACLEQWSTALEGKKFLGGDEPNAADLSVFGILHSVEKLSAFSAVKANPNVFAWYQRCAGKVKFG